jgi:hypothetical protein
VRCYGWQHTVFDEPVEPYRLLYRADVLAPAVVRMGAEAMDCDDTRRLSTSRGQRTSESDILDNLSSFCLCWCVAEHLQADVIVGH